MKVYLAGRYRQRLYLCGVRAVLESMGVQVTSRWLDEATPYTEKRAEIDRAAPYLALRDLEDIWEANLVVVSTMLLTERDSPTLGGPYVEMGYALGLGVTTVVVGPKTNIFTYLPQVLRFLDWDSFYREVAARVCRRENPVAVEGPGGRVVDFGAAVAVRRNYVGPEVPSTPGRDIQGASFNVANSKVGPVEYQKPAVA